MNERHQPESRDFKTVLNFDPVSSSTLLRVPCSCGWKGSWFADGDYAERSFERHVQQAMAAERIADVRNDPTVYEAL